MVEILILGLGWTGVYVKNLCMERNILFESTSTTGRENTIKFIFDSETSTPLEFERLPAAKYVLITFPFKTLDDAQVFLKLYEKAHKLLPHFILIGSTGPFKGTPWAFRGSEVVGNERYLTETLFLQKGNCVLNLAGLFGGIKSLKRL